MSDSQETVNSQQSQSMSQQSNNDSFFESKGQDYQIQKSSSANVSMNMSDESQIMGSVRRIKSDNYQKKNDTSSYYNKHNQNGNQRYHNNENKYNKSYGSDNNSRRNNQQNRRNNKPSNFSNSSNPQQFNNFPMASTINNKMGDNNSSLNLLTQIGNNFPNRNTINSNFYNMPNLIQPPLPPSQHSQNPKNQFNQQQQVMTTITPQQSSLLFLQNSSKADGTSAMNFLSNSSSLQRLQQFQKIAKNSGNINLLINSSSSFSTQELDNQIKQELNSYNEEQVNINYSSWASVLNTKEAESGNNNEGSQIKGALQTDFYSEELQNQLDESVKRLDKGNLIHYQVDISEQDNSSPFEYLKQFRIDNSGHRSLREDYLDLMANLDLYTEKLYYAIQDKAADHLKKNNFNTQTMLQNNYNHNYVPTSFAAQQQQQNQMQAQRNNAKSIIKGAVQTVLEYSETRTVVPRYAREGDWLCQCGNLNFSYRDTCNKCLVMKPKYQYTKNTELFMKLDQFEKQLMNIDSTIAAPPQQEQIITQQRQIILSDFIWICKCCRSINYCKTSTCVSCKMYKYIDRTKLIEISKNSQKKLAKYAIKMQERHQKNIQTIQSSESDNQQIQEASIEELIEDPIISQPEKLLFNGSDFNFQSSSSSSSSSDEGPSENSEIKIVAKINEDLNTTEEEQITLSSAQQEHLLNLSTDSDTKQSHNLNATTKDKQCIFIMDQLDNTCDADYSSSDSEPNLSKFIAKKAPSSVKKSVLSVKKPTSSVKKSAIKSLLKSSKSKKKSSKKQEISILDELKEYPVKKIKFSKESILVEDNDKTFIDESIPEVQQEQEIDVNLNTTDVSCFQIQLTHSSDESSTNVKKQEESIVTLEQKIIVEEDQCKDKQYPDTDDSLSLNDQFFDITKDLSDNDSAQQQKPKIQEDIQNKTIKEISPQKPHQQESQSQEQQVIEVDEESLLMGLNDDDFQFDFDS